MKSILQQIISNTCNNGKTETMPTVKVINEGTSENNRREFIKKAALGGIALGSFLTMPVEDTIAQSTSKVQRSSSPSDLKITDMRVAVLGDGGRKAIIRIDGISDYMIIFTVVIPVNLLYFPRFYLHPE